jgi:hypothetical protein
VAARAWGVPPWEIEAAAAAGLLTAGDLAEAILLEAETPFLGEVIRPFLERERFAELRSVQDQIIRMATAMKGTTDTAKRAELAMRVEQLQEREARLLGGGQA